MDWKKLVLGGFSLVVIAAWMATGAAFFFEMSPQVRFGALFIAAAATDGIFWAAAFVFGFSVIESRRRIWRWITGRGWALPEDAEDNEPTSS